MDESDVQHQGDAYDPTNIASYTGQGMLEEDDDDDYDPSNMQFQDAHSANQSAGDSGAGDGSSLHAAASTKQRTVGGFIEDDDDDEDAPAVTANTTTAGQDISAAALSAAGQAPRSVTQTPVNATPDISNEKAATTAAQDQGFAPPRSSSSTGVIATTAPVPIINIDHNPPASVASATSAASAPLSNGAAGVQSSGVTPSQSPFPQLSAVHVAPAQNVPSSSSVPLPKARLPQDRVGILEDRIAADPRGDTDAWLSLIEEYKQRNKIDEVYETYERFLKIFPQAGDQWAAYIQTMMQNEDTRKAETSFNKVLLNVPHVRCWSLYIDHIRRMNNLATDQTQQARSVITSAFEFTFKHVGNDPNSMQLWQDYINFVKSAPGNVAGDGWQDKQKVDAVRKAYRQALSIPLPNLQGLWSEYSTFEMTASRVNGRKFMNEQMPAYMTAKQAYIALENKIQLLNRSTLPRFPPLPGYEGYEDYQNQLRIWRDWIEWEKQDPLVLKDEKPDGSAFKNRVLFVYKIALMTLRFEPQMWFEAAQFCFDNDLKDEGEKLLDAGIKANPESCLLAFAQADRIETQTVGDNDPVARGATVRQPYNKLIDALYDLLKQTRERSEREVAEIQERYTKEAMEAQQSREQSRRSDDDDDDDTNGSQDQAKLVAARRDADIKAVQEKYNAQLHELRRIITAAWVALIRAMRRIQGKGKPGSSDLPGSRGILSETRKRGNITSDLYIQCALTEWYCYKDPAALRLFDKGMTLYPTDENFALEYIKHLIAQSDLTNARTVFEKAVSRLEKEPSLVHKAKPLYYYFHTFESKYGELAQIQKLEQRMRDLFPEDPTLRVFAHRFEYENALANKFDPTTVQPIISPGTQMRPVIMQSIEQDAQPAYLNAAGIAQSTFGTSSPKRPLDGTSNIEGPPRKLARGESPLKGAAGRRLASARTSGNTPLQSVATLSTGGLWPIPHHINFLLSLLPNARYAANMTPALDPVGVVNIMRGVNLQPNIWAGANLKAAGPGLMDPRYHQPVPIGIGNAIQPPQQQLPRPPPPVSQHAPPPPVVGVPPVPGYGHPPPAIPPQPYPQYAPPPNTAYQYAAPVNAPYPPGSLR
ncbi:hypothetical protein, variant [Verruconis gallopava]|uniref:mRNA 3'-end-processing protein RNA14 n=1 Tax=Verruconis gallopava TaxID=253628 RepID=A0A0D1YJ04_9PEZI|nr:hypothetical protein, variant [Verruconis gallopava]KIW00857.1 hypothetical protein, variant [Verruconis gallopava]